MNEMASQCAAESFYCFAQWGADRAVRQRKTTSSSSDEPQLSSGYRGALGNVSHYTTTEIVASALDLDAVVQAAQQLSSMLDTKSLLRSALDLVLDNTGATRVSLLLSLFLQ